MEDGMSEEVQGGKNIFPFNMPKQDRVLLRIFKSCTS